MPPSTMTLPPHDPTPLVVPSRSLSIEEMWAQTPLLGWEAMGSFSPLGRSPGGRPLGRAIRIAGRRVRRLSLRLAMKASVLACYTASVSMVVMFVIVVWL